MGPGYRVIQERLDTLWEPLFAKRAVGVFRFSPRGTSTLQAAEYGELALTTRQVSGSWRRPDQAEPRSTAYPWSTIRDARRSGEGLGQSSPPFFVRRLSLACRLSLARHAARSPAQLTQVLHQDEQPGREHPEDDQLPDQLVRHHAERHDGEPDRHRRHQPGQASPKDRLDHRQYRH